jgi:probable HAF family extracellular repeat protein
MERTTTSHSRGASRRQTLRNLGVQIAALSILATLSAQRTNAQSYTVTEFPNGPVGVAINGGGQFCGYGSKGEELWTPKKPNGPTGKAVKLPPLPATGKWSSDAYADSLNSSGTVAGYTQFSKQVGKIYGVPQYTFTYTATVWQNAAPIALPSGGSNSWANGINSSGDVVGEIQGVATLWHNGVATSLSTPTNCTSTAYAINDAGQIVGGIYDASGVNHATLWMNGTAYDLGTLSSFTWGIAVGINNAGLVTGDVVGTDSTGTVITHAFLWTPKTPNGVQGTMMDLSMLPGTDDSYAYSINSSGQVVGMVVLESRYSPCAFIWDSVHGMRDLNTLLPAAYANIPFWYAYSINDSGQIVGMWGDNGARLLTPQ